MTTQKITTFLMCPAAHEDALGGTPSACDESGGHIRKSAWKGVHAAALSAFGPLTSREAVNARLHQLFESERSDDSPDSEYSCAVDNPASSAKGQAGNEEEEGFAAGHSVLHRGGCTLFAPMGADQVVDKVSRLGHVGDLSDARRAAGSHEEVGLQLLCHDAVARRPVEEASECHAVIARVERDQLEADPVAQRVDVICHVSALQAASEKVEEVEAGGLAGRAARGNAAKELFVEECVGVVDIELVANARSRRLVAQHLVDHGGNACREIPVACGPVMPIPKPQSSSTQDFRGEVGHRSTPRSHEIAHHADSTSGEQAGADDERRVADRDSDCKSSEQDEEQDDGEVEGGAHVLSPECGRGCPRPVEAESEFLNTGSDRSEQNGKRPLAGHLFRGRADVAVRAAHQKPPVARWAADPGIALQCGVTGIECVCRTDGCGGRNCPRADTPGAAGPCDVCDPNAVVDSSWFCSGPGVQLGLYGAHGIRFTVARAALSAWRAVYAGYGWSGFMSGARFGFGGLLGRQHLLVGDITPGQRMHAAHSLARHALAPLGDSACRHIEMVGNRLGAALLGIKPVREFHCTSLDVAKRKVKRQLNLIVNNLAVA